MDPKDPNKGASSKIFLPYYVLQTILSIKLSCDLRKGSISSDEWLASSKHLLLKVKKCGGRVYTQSVAQEDLRFSFERAGPNRYLVLGANPRFSCRFWGWTHDFMWILDTNP